MAAAPQYATFTFIGVSGAVYNVDAYLSDVAAARVTWDSGSGAGTGSLTYWIAPEQVTLTDFSIKTGMTDTTYITLVANAAQVPNVKLRYANFLNTLTTRPPIKLTFRQGTQIGAVQT